MIIAIFVVGLSSLYLFIEYEKLSVEFRIVNIELSALRDAYWMNSEERVNLIKGILQYHDKWVEYWENLDVESSELVVKTDINPLFSSVIVYPRDLVPEEYALAILRICRQTKTEISETFGLIDSFSNRRILICMFPGDPPSLFTDRKNDSIIMVLRTEDLTAYKKNQIYGFIHEMAHISTYPTYLGDEFNEGWAIYASTRVFWNVIEKLGDEIWPTTINATEDIQKVLTAVETGEQPFIKAARALFEIDKKYGPWTIGKALKKLPIREESHATWLELKQSLIDVTGNPEAINEIFSNEGF